MVAIDIDRDKVYVTYAGPIEPEDVAGCAERLNCLIEDEVRRAERFHFDRDRRLFIASRALVRRSLARCINVEPTAFRFDTNEYGRPRIVFPREGRLLRFSASRTNGLAMCAVAFDRDVGADVERLQDCPFDVARWSFAPVEVRSIDSCPEGERSERFFTYWTLKEAYIKARGLGLSIPLDRFAFHLTETRPPRLEIDPELDRQASGWRFFTLRPTMTHLAALCVHHPDRRAVSISLAVL
jgi:4'-phosphopantetheinyl transferase